MKGIRFWLGIVVLLWVGISLAADFVATYPQARNIFPDADSFGAFEGAPPSAPVIKNGQTIGFIYLSEDAVRIPGYSGHPINILVGLDLEGRIVGLSVVRHDEPILAVGIKPERLQRYVAQYQGQSAFDRVIIGAPREGYEAVDGISGATITVMVINSTIMKSARMVAEARGLKATPEGMAHAREAREHAARERAEHAGEGRYQDEPVPHASEPAADSPVVGRADVTTKSHEEERPEKAQGHEEPRHPVSRQPETARDALTATPAKAFGNAPPRVSSASASPAATAPAAAPASPVASSAAINFFDEDAPWVGIWRNRSFDIVVLLGGLLVLGLILVFQDWFAHRPRLLHRVRLGFHLYTLFFIGWWGLAQLSVINVLTFTGAVMNGFRWENFLIDPMIFILWGFVATTLLLWGRGVYCGWLCPFGALQELILVVSRKLKLPEMEFSDAVHERLVALKYIILILLFGISLQSIVLAAHFAEVEPFKTVIALRFQRDWQYVFYAFLLIAIAAVNRKFYCKYLCPLGAALAIPGRFRLFDWWLRRRKECGKPCQVCAHQCPVRAIRATGEINANECHYCLDCQVIYYDDRVCPPLLERRKRREAQLQRVKAEIGGAVPAAEEATTRKQ